jgi:hypothetical protein
MGGLSQVDPIEFDLSGTPVWVVGAAIQGGLRWFVVMGDGRVETITIPEEGQPSQEALSIVLSPGQPPVVDLSSGSLVDFSNLDDASTLTHPILTEQGRLVWIDQGGDVVLNDFTGQELDRFVIHALPDARLVVTGDLIAVYAQATDVYDHAVLGDGLEGGQLVVLDTSAGEMRFAAQITPPTGFVYEGLSPMMVDWNQDGELEVLATISDYQTGARFVLYSLEGQVLAESEPAGQAYRWRHQIAVFAFESGGERLLASVLRPHLDGLVQLHAWRGDELVEVDSLAGYSSHRIGERNLDQAAAGDFDGDGAAELLLGDLQMGSLVLLGWDGQSQLEEWRFDLDGVLVTNIGTIETTEGNMAVAVGTNTGQLVVWCVGH